MKKFIYSFIFLFFLFDTSSFAAVTVISDDDERTKVTKNGKTYLSQIWYGNRFEVDEEVTFGTKKLQKVDATKYEKYLKEVDERVLNKIGDYKVYIIQNQLKDYKTFTGLSFTDNTAVIFGTYYKMSDRAIATLAVHELGHNVDFRLMDEKLWKEYKEIRGITNAKIYNDNAKDQKNRPQEIFAEDFRLLYGGEDARITSHVNSDLENPTENEELKAFFEKVIGE